jgi:exonuclease VII small subunit
MDVQEIIAELKNETARLNQAIAALEDAGSRSEITKSRTSVKAMSVAKIRQASAGKKPGKGMSAEARKRISEAMKKRWAAQRKSA